MNPTLPAKTCRCRYYASLVLLLLSVAITAQAQDAHFSQFFEAPLLRNPALAGLFTGDVRVQSVTRSQWGGLTTPYQTGSLNAEYKTPVGRNNDYLTLGLETMYDKAGAINFTTINVMPALNYHKSLSDDKTKFLSLGFMGGFVQRSIDRSKVTTNNQFDGFGYNPALADGESFSQSTYTYWDGSVGMSFNSAIAGNKDNNYYIGLAYHHFNTPMNSFYKDPNIELHSKIVVSGGLKLATDEVSALTFLADYGRQGSFEETELGVLYSRKIGVYYDQPDYTIHFGGFIRWNDALIPVVKLDYHPFAIAVSYDVNISAVKTASQQVGGLEVSVSYMGFLSRDNSSKNAVACPRF